MRKLACSSLTPVFSILMAFLLGLVFYTPSYASENIMRLPDSNSDIRGSITHNIYGGCMFQGYALANNFNPYLLYAPDGTNTCGYRWVNNALSHYSNTQVGYSRTSFYDGVISANSYERNGGYNVTASWSDAPEAMKKKAHNVVRSIEFSLASYNQQGQAQPWFSTPYREGYSFFAYRWDTQNGVSGVVPYFEFNATYYDSAGNALDTDSILSIKKKIRENTVFSCGSAQPNLLPSDFSEFWNNWNDGCFAITAIPTSTNYSMSVTAAFLYPSSTDYEWRYENGSAVNSHAMYFIQHSGSYYDSVWDNSLKATNDMIMSNVCSDVDECQVYATYADLLKSNRSNALEAGDYGSTSVYMNWFNVFGFGFTFPFLTLFNSFSSSSCVDIPIIAGMLYLPSDTEYCTWWSPELRATITPVFNIIILMIITGFIYSFLKGHSQPANPNPSIYYEKRGKE